MLDKLHVNSMYHTKVHNLTTAEFTKWIVMRGRAAEWSNHFSRWKRTISCSACCILIGYCSHSVERAKWNFRLSKCSPSKMHRIKVLKERGKYSSIDGAAAGMWLGRFSLLSNRTTAFFLCAFFLESRQEFREGVCFLHIVNLWYESENLVLVNHWLNVPYFFWI